MLDLLTDTLDLLGLLLIVAALAVGAGVLLGVTAALGVAGVGLLAVSWLVDRLLRPRKRKGSR